MTSTLEHEETETDEALDGAKHEASDVKENTRRGIGIASFSDTLYADGRDWGPARLRDDYDVPEQPLATWNI